MNRAVGNWARWGDGDQRGALNLLTPDVVRAGLGAVRVGEVASLSLPLQRRGMPTYPTRPPIVHVMTVDGGDYEAGAKRGPGGFQFADDYVAMAGHAGTHVDALSHVARDGVMYNAHSARSVRSATGARKLGIEHFRGLVTRALVLDIPAILGGEPLAAGAEIGIDHLESALALGEESIRPGDAILLRTGWLERFAEGDGDWFESEPGLGLPAARWLAERDVVLIGADNFGVEVVPSTDGEAMPVHLVCIQEYGIHLMELVDLSPLTAARVSSCLLIVAPLPIVGGVGCPVNPIAVY